jgi:hypothetical protein
MNIGCPNCDDTGWVCERHEDRPWDGGSSRHDACGCGPGVPCECNPFADHSKVMAEVICSIWET